MTWPAPEVPLVVILLEVVVIVLREVLFALPMVAFGVVVRGTMGILVSMRAREKSRNDMITEYYAR